jgi:hypothetical protein
MIIVSLVISVALLVAVGALARSRFGARGICWLSAAVVVPSCLCFSPALALQSLLTFVVTLGCLAYRATPRTVTWAAVGAMVTSHGLIVSMAAPELLTLSKLRKEFPLQSVSDRLAYETKANGALARAETASEIHLSPNVEQRLVWTEESQNPVKNWYDRNVRRRMLTSLHNRTSDEFVFAQGFGPTRMAGLNHVYAEGIRLPEQGPIPLQQESDPPYNPGQDSAVPAADAELRERLQPAENELTFLHNAGVADFLDAGRMGFVRDRDHVAGFQSHQFTKIPELTIPKDEPSLPWRIVRLELVSLLTHDVPMAYISKNLPKLDELRNAPTRSLDDFERQSIDRLRSDEDVVTDETPDRIRMVGSLRAAKNCLECHFVKRGELLGALSYELVPVGPTVKKAPQVARPSS